MRGSPNRPDQLSLFDTALQNSVKRTSVKSPSPLIRKLDAIIARQKAKPKEDPHDPSTKQWPEAFFCRICGRYSRSWTCLPPEGTLIVRYCGRCRALLMNAESIKRGFGPICWQSVKKVLDSDWQELRNDDGEGFI